ncbi:glycosyltransferase [Pseudomonas aeruginosa]|uniref:glycosyltransferase n=3 Tax=Pseudomonas aeruginosa TaxID=287 RepID=UPI003983AA44
MCGIAGFWNITGTLLGDNARVARQMAAAIHHRGPDESGIWYEAPRAPILVHARLAVLELSPAGSQPMHSDCGRYVLIYNGEIYNHLALRARLSEAGVTHSWRGGSDTETLLACFAQWGVESTLKLTVGMFALALWDRQEKTITLARDRMGEKPLYWGWQNGVLFFASELKALKEHPLFRGDIDRDALALFLRYGYVPAPYSIYKGIGKLRAGSYLVLSERSLNETCEPAAYWSANAAIEEALSNPFQGTDAEAVDLLESQLRTSISDQMVSDVPLGAFLSGGVDSSTVVALMQQQSSRPIEATGYAERFILLGERQDVASCLKAMDIFCLHSRTEGFPNVLGEAMAMGLPCITTDVGDAAYLLGNDGVVVPALDPNALGKGIEDLIALDVEGRRALGEAARQRIYSNFTMASASQRFMSLYRDILVKRKA